ncbi:MAG TPA: glycosyltransferase [Lapillicoccus sp.]|jgi:glycosyltransferase involved in cell wall biosynthesis|nr:glycosyltransferase [Lapillicoccus sp.]
MSALDPDMIERVKADKRKRSSSTDLYQESPRLALILQSFNRISNIEQLVDGVRRLGDHELIVCEDGSLDGSHEKWMSYLTRRNDFLIHSNDLHEIRILDRAIRFARSEIVCLVQDDDLIPRDTNWLDSVLEQFANNPRLAIVGGFMGFDSFDPDPAMAKRIWGDEDFRFVHHVNIGPYFIRRRIYEALGGWEYSFSQVGEPGIGYDNELCLRAWLSDYQVGYTFVPFKGPAGHYPANGGTVLFSNEVRVRNSVKNSDVIFERYGPHAERIEMLVAAANATLHPSLRNATYEPL